MSEIAWHLQEAGDWHGQVPAIVVELGLDLVQLVDPALGGTLMDRVVPARVALAHRTGFIMPGIAFRDGPIPRSDWRVEVAGQEAAGGKAFPGWSLVTPTRGAPRMPRTPGLEALDPATRAPASWVAGSAAARRAQLAGQAVRDATDVVLAGLLEAVRAWGGVLLSEADLRVMLAKAREKAPDQTAAAERRLAASEIGEVLRRMLVDGVSFRDLAATLQAMADAPAGDGPAEMAERRWRGEAAAIARRLACPPDPALSEPTGRDAAGRLVIPPRDATGRTAGPRRGPRDPVLHVVAIDRRAAGHVAWLASLPPEHRLLPMAAEAMATVRQIHDRAARLRYARLPVVFLAPREARHTLAAAFAHVPGGVTAFAEDDVPEDLPVVDGGGGAITPDPMLEPALAADAADGWGPGLAPALGRG